MDISLTQNLDIEKFFLASCIKYPRFLYEVIGTFDLAAFSNKSHEIIFQCLQHLVRNKKDVDLINIKVFLGNLNTKYEGDIKLEDYVEGLYFLSDLKENKCHEYYEDLKKYYVARKTIEAADRIKREVLKNLNEPADYLLSLAETELKKAITVHVSEEDPIDIYSLFADLENAEDVDDGLKPPFPIYYETYGGFLTENVYTFMSPYGEGKSTMLNYLAEYLSTNCNCRALVLDTELSTKEVVDRAASNKSGVNEYFLRTGEWKKWQPNSDGYKKVKGIIDESKNKLGRYYHRFVPGKPIDTVLSIIRRWHAMNIKEGEVPLIVYDYIKLTGEKIDNFNKDYQVLGEKVDKLNQIAKEIGGVILTAVQTNAEGNVAGSRKIAEFTSNLYLFRRKTFDEINRDGKNYGTHVLEEVKSRKQGRNAHGFDKWIEIKEGNGKIRYEENYLNFEVKNFSVKEVCSRKDLILGRAGQILNKSEQKKHDDDLDVFA